MHQSGNLTNSLRLLKEDYLTFPGKGFSKNKKTFLIIEPERETYAPPVGEGLGADEGSTLQNIEERYIENETNGADFTLTRPQETITKEGWIGALKQTLEESFLFQEKKI